MNSPTCLPAAGARGWSFWRRVLADEHNVIRSKSFIFG